MKKTLFLIACSAIVASLSFFLIVWHNGELLFYFRAPSLTLTLIAISGFILLINWFIFFYTRAHNKKTSKWFSLSLWGIILVTSLLVIQIYKFPAIAFYRRPISISLNELSKANLTQTSAIYYIGRDDCPACREFYPSLMELSTKYQKKIYYYNTQQDRNDNSTSLRYVLQKYEIDEVPVILIFDGNGGIQKISSQNILENFSNYLEATRKT